MRNLMDEMFGDGFSDMQAMLEQYRLVNLDPDGSLCPGDTIHIAWVDDQEAIRMGEFRIAEIQGPPGHRDYRLIDDDQEVVDEGAFWIRDQRLTWDIITEDDLASSEIVFGGATLGVGQTRAELYWAVTLMLTLFGSDGDLAVDTVVHHLTPITGSTYERMRDLPEGGLEDRAEEIDLGLLELAVD